MIDAIITYQMYNDRGDYRGDRYTETFDAEQTRGILDTLPLNDIEYFRENGTSNEEGDGFYYSAEAMGLAENLHGDSISVYIFYSDTDWMDYIASREERGIAEEGGKIDAQAFHLRATLQKINALIESLPQEQVILWLAGDGSWGGLPGLGLYLPEQVTEDMREQYGIEDDNI